MQPRIAPILLQAKYVFLKCRRFRFWDIGLRQLQHGKRDQFALNVGFRSAVPEAAEGLRQYSATNPVTKLSQSAGAAISSAKTGTQRPVPTRCEVERARQSAAIEACAISAEPGALRGIRILQPRTRIPGRRAFQAAVLQADRPID